MSTWNLTKYKITYWSAYNEVLRQCETLTIWFEPDMAWNSTPMGKRRRQPSFNNAAIQTCGLLRSSASACGIAAGSHAFSGPMQAAQATLQRSLSAHCYRSSDTQRRSTVRPDHGKSLVRRLQKSCPLRAGWRHLAAKTKRSFVATTLPQCRCEPSLTDTAEMILPH